MKKEQKLRCLTMMMLRLLLSVLNQWMIKLLSLWLKVRRNRLSLKKLSKKKESPRLMISLLMKWSGVLLLMNSKFNLKILVTTRQNSVCQRISLQIKSEKNWMLVKKKYLSNKVLWEMKKKNLVTRSALNSHTSMVWVATTVETQSKEQDTNVPFAKTSTSAQLVKKELITLTLSLKFTWKSIFHQPCSLLSMRVCLRHMLISSKTSVKKTQWLNTSLEGKRRLKLKKTAEMMKRMILIFIHEIIQKFWNLKLCTNTWMAKNDFVRSKLFG